MVKSKRKSRRKSLNCKYGILKRPVRDKKSGKMRYCKKAPRRKSKRKSLNCKYGILKRPVRDKKSGKMRYCKKAPRRKSKRKSLNCKYGILKRPVRDKKSGKMRYCKKAPRRKSKRKSRRKSRRKQGGINYSPNKNINKGCVDRSALPLRAHQKNVVKYLDTHKGILAIHGTGTGKTLTAVTASQCFLDQNPDKKVIVVSPAALVHNFAKELGKYRNVKHVNNYEFYSYERFLNKMFENGLKEKI